jgi:hypothetical protein
MGISEDSGKGSLIRINNFRFGIRVPYSVGSFQPQQPSAGNAPLAGTQFQFQDVGFHTNLDVREGQKVVVGKNQLPGAGHGFVLVVSARTVD